MTALTQQQLDGLSLEQQKEVVARGIVECPECHSRVAWLGDQGACVHLFGKCLTCLLFIDYMSVEGTELEDEADAKVAQVQALREERERWCGRRVFPCPSHRSLEKCPLCGDEGWILGYPPGAAPADKG